jgi:MFS family permease
VPAGLRGRIMALYAALLLGGTTAGAPVLGWIGQTFGPRWAPITGGVLTMLGTTVACYRHARRQRGWIRRSVPAAAAGAAASGRRVHRET